MKKITSFLMLFLMCFGMAWAQLPIGGVKVLPTTKVTPSALATGYYMLKEVNPGANGKPGGWLKAASEADGAVVTPQGKTNGQYNNPADLNDCGTYLWYIEKNETNGTFTIASVNKLAAWQAPSIGGKNLVAYANKAELKVVTNQVTLGGHTAQAAEGSFMLAKSDETAFFHYTGNNLGSWTDVNPASVMMFEAYNVPTSDLVEKLPFALSTLNADGTFKEAVWCSVKMPDAGNRYMQVNGVDLHAKTSKTTDKSHLFAFVKDGDAYQIYNYAVKNKVMGVTSADEGTQVKMLDKNTGNTHWVFGINGNGYYFKNTVGNNTYVNRYQGAQNTALKIWQNGNAAKNSESRFVFETPDLNLPVAGKKYYLYNDHQKGKQYFYDNNGQMGWATATKNEKNYVWTCTENADGSFVLRNYGTGQYFGWQEIGKTAYNWVLSSKNQVVHPDKKNISMYSEGKSRFLVCTFKNNNWSFNQSTHSENSAEHASDFHFEECTLADNDFATEPVTAYFAEAYGQKWVRLNFYRNATYGAEANEAGASNLQANYGDNGQVWSLVGTSDNFKIYNLEKGETVALTVANAKSETAATFVTAKDACSWKLVAKEYGSFAIVPVLAIDGEECSLNSFGGIGGPLKLYKSSDAGGWWKLQLVVKGFTLTNVIVGTNPYPENNDRAGDIMMTIDGANSWSAVKAAGEMTYYLPTGASVAIQQSFEYRGFKKGGFLVDNVEKTSVSFTLGTEGQPSHIVSKFIVAPERGQYLFKTPGKDGHPYRIPAIATAPNGDIIAISDFRTCGADIGNGEVDIMYRISKDNGLTWSNEEFLANGVGDKNGVKNYEWNVGFGDAAVVMDCERNEFMAMMVCGRTLCWDGNYIPNDPKSNPNRVAQVRGHYDEAQGKWVFTAPEEVSESVYSIFNDGNKENIVRSLFIGSGRICQSRVTKVGDYYRLYCAVWNIDGSTGKNKANRVIYSDDFGKTWKVLGGASSRPAPGGDEPKCEEMPDGSVILSSRTNGRIFNIYKFTDAKTGAGQWMGHVYSNGNNNGVAVGNSTNGEIMMFHALKKDGSKAVVALQSVPWGGGRSDVGIFYKEITADLYQDVTKLASNWTKGLQVSNVGSAYSTMTLQKDNKIGFFFEENPGDYSMVYIPLTLEEMTNDEFALDTEAYGMKVSTKDAKSLGALSTFSAAYATTPSVAGVKAYYATENTGNAVKMTEIAAGTDGKVVIPAHTGVLLQTANAQEFKMLYSEEKGAALSQNLLKHTANGAVSVAADVNAYILSGDEVKGAAFFKLSATDRTIAANRAYLVLNAAAAQKMSISFGDLTGIEGVEAAAAADAPVYDLSGRRVAKAVKGGVYIQNGKKFIVK